jgi:hypothetical protein
MADLNEAGQLEAIARAIWFLMRPGYYEPDGGERHDTQLTVAKATHGKTGLIRLWHDLSRMYFRGWEAKTDGLFPGDNTEEEARQSTRSRNTSQADLFGGAHAQEKWEKDGDNDDY